MASAAEKAKLDRIRGLVDRLKGSEWQVGSEGEGMILAAAGALDYCRFLLGLVDRASDRIRQLVGKPERAPGARREKDHAAEAAMLCQRPDFKRFLIERHGLEQPATDERTAQRLRSVLAVTSRAEINQSAAVRERWLALRADFHAWKRGMQ